MHQSVENGLSTPPTTKTLESNMSTHSPFMVITMGADLEFGSALVPDAA